MKTERILVWGYDGSGKSRGLCDIARYIQPTGAKVYVLDTDDAYERVLEEGKFKDVDNMELFVPMDFDEARQWAWDLPEHVRPEFDWVGIDRMSWVREQIREWYSLRSYGQTVTERLLEHKKELIERGQGVSKPGRFNAFDTGDNQSMSSVYKEWVGRALYRHRGNVYMGTGTQKTYDSDSEAVRSLYGWFGSKPAGDRELGNEPHTSIYLNCPERRAWTATTFKERGGRKWLEEVPVEDFAELYLRRVAKFGTGDSDTSTRSLGGTTVGTEEG